jgi:hypothetical protein
MASGKLHGNPKPVRKHERKVVLMPNPSLSEVAQNIPVESELETAETGVTEPLSARPQCQQSPAMAGPFIP